MAILILKNRFFFKLYITDARYLTFYVFYYIYFYTIVIYLLLTPWYT